MLEHAAITLEMYDPFESFQLTGIVLDVKPRIFPGAFFNSIYHIK